MKRLLLIAIVLSILASSGFAFSPQAGPEETIQKFYAWYLGRLNKNDMTPLKNRTVALQYLTPEFLKRVPRLIKETDSDVIICAQDFDPLWEKNIKVDPPTITGASATTLVQLIGKEMSVKLSVTLKKIPAGWRINSVECAE